METGKKNWLHLLVILVVIFNVANCLASGVDITPPVFIAHAGGAIGNRTYTNSLEALDANYEKGHRFFEMDFSWTADGQLVAIHDWDNAFRQMFLLPENAAIPTKTQFLELPTKNGLTQLSLEQVLHWVQEKGDAFLVTDVKAHNVKALNRINTYYKKFKKHIIPQVYSYLEYDKAARLGYSNIILTLYRMKTDPLEVLSFSKTHSPFAITMPWQMAQKGLAYYLYKNHTLVYAHTVNDINLFNSLRRVGVYGIYTDYISPP